LKNHHGQNSLLVLRPADVHETTAAWKLAVENTQTPTALILSRQNIKNLPADSGNRYQEALQAAKGAYVVQKAVDPDVVLLANGSEVATLIDVAVLLKERKNLNVQVVSAPSEGLFFNQPEAYRRDVIPDRVPVFGLTAGLPSTLYRLAGKNGMVQGLDHFGYSAPYKVLDEKFGYTAETVYNNVVKFINK
jgi:transketolase